MALCVHEEEWCFCQSSNILCTYQASDKGVYPAICLREAILWAATIQTQRPLLRLSRCTLSFLPSDLVIRTTNTQCSNPSPRSQRCIPCNQRLVLLSLSPPDAEARKISPKASLLRSEPKLDISIPSHESPSHVLIFLFATGIVVFLAAGLAHILEALRHECALPLSLHLVRVTRHVLP
jgi:hypothetical protein